jgi:hypothetical protein
LLANEAKTSRTDHNLAHFSTKLKSIAQTGYVRTDAIYRNVLSSTGASPPDSNDATLASSLKRIHELRFHLRATGIPTDGKRHKHWTSGACQGRADWPLAAGEALLALREQNASTFSC